MGDGATDITSLLRSVRAGAWRGRTRTAAVQIYWLIISVHSSREAFMKNFPGQHKTQRIGRLTVITDTVLQSRLSHEELARLAIAGGADTIQFRQKSGPTRSLIETARKIKRMCERAGVTFIVNDRLDVAIASGAHGVHLGQEDFPALLARKIMGKDCIIGGSAATLDEAKKCLSDKVDYIGFGPVFPTSSKADAGPVSLLEGLKEAVQKVPLPIVAIGGITAENTLEVMKAGAYGIAVISAVCCQKDPQEATRKLCESIKASLA